MTGKHGKDDDFLKSLGQRVLTARILQGLSRKALAVSSDVSERYIAQLECGKGNISILLLRRITSALRVPLANLVTTDTESRRRRARKPLVTRQANATQEAERRVDNTRQEAGHVSRPDSTSARSIPSKTSIRRS